MHLKIIVPILLASLSFSLSAQIDGLKHATVAVVVKDIDSGDTLQNINPDLAMTPASVMKLVTTGAALETLGSNYRYSTNLLYRGELRDSVLYGDLIIQGSGDPSLGSSHFENSSQFILDWIDAIKKAGIKSIQGSVISDEHIYDEEGVSLGWTGADYGNYYACGCYGLNVFDNLYRISFKTGRKLGSLAEILGTEPEQPQIHFNNQMKAGRWDSSLIFGMPFSYERDLYGTVPRNCHKYTIKGDIPDPPFYLAYYFTEKLREAEISVSGQPSSYRLIAANGVWKSDRLTTLVVTQSPSVESIVSIANHKSHNLFADGLFKTLGLSWQPSEREPANNFARGAHAVKQFWDSKGFDTSALYMLDGSGLAPADKLTAGFLCDLLVWMATKSKVPDNFIESLPLAGEEGSVRNVLKGSRLQGNARLKSGGMHGVRTFAGYINKDDKRYAVVVLTNNFTCSSKTATRAIERYLLSIF